MVHSAPFTRLVWYTYLREGDMSSMVAKGGGGGSRGLFVSPFSPFVLGPCPGPWW